MDSQAQAAYRLTLLELRERLMRSVNLVEEELREDLVTPGDTTSVPTHPGDADAEGMDALIEIAHNEEGLFEQAEAALARIQAGTFGACEECGREISPERLDALPYTALCIDCARRQGRDERS